uniref:EGF-like domain-containing protein n=1 Tax=Elaeophora elaphi TaxID=1147741 RepID=A0A0R3RTA0_9BILA
MTVQCPQSFTWECEELNCCESYHFRVILLFIATGLFLAALLVAAVWLTFEFRTSYRRKRLRETDQFRNELEMRSFEEAKYLRRMSQNKFV